GWGRRRHSALTGAQPRTRKRLMSRTSQGSVDEVPTGQENAESTERMADQKCHDAVMAKVPAGDHPEHHRFACQGAEVDREHDRESVGEPKDSCDRRPKNLHEHQHSTAPDLEMSRHDPLAQKK